MLTAPSETAGTANIDFVIFPERWAVAEHSFRPPWYHMNIMSEFMGLIYGVYDAKPEGFTPGGVSLHNCMLPHGPDKAAYDHATKVELKPVKLTNTLAFMFETRFPQHLTKFAAELDTLQETMPIAGRRSKKQFTGNPERARRSMKLASLKHGRDGRLLVVSRDLKNAASPRCVGGPRTLQAALDDLGRGGAAAARRSADRSRAGGIAHVAVRFPTKCVERRCRAPTSGRTARPTSITSSWCGRRAAPRCRPASGPIR